MPVQGSMPALDESWASLDASDFSTEDELQSENADTSSLVDLSSTHDTESAVEDDTHSEVNLDEDRAASMLVGEPSHQDQEQDSGRLQQMHGDPAMEDTIILQRSQVQQNQDSVDLEYSRQLPTFSMTGQPSQQFPTQETITMTISRSSFDLSSRPFNLAYCGAASLYDTKDDLLGKIGAALLACPSIPNSRLASASPCFNIVPTEFGPASKPAFADLIPSQAQMTVEDLTLLKPNLNKPASIRFAFKRGLLFESGLNGESKRIGAESWRPDLLVIHISREDLAEDFHTTNEVLELAKRHYWPTITVTNHATNGLCPMSYRHGIVKTQQIKTEDGVMEMKQPIDLDSFINLDTDQLNRHIKYIMDDAREEQAKGYMQTSSYTFIQSLTRVIFPHINEASATSGRFILQLAEPETQPDKPEQHSMSFSQQIQEACSAINIRDMLKDVFLSLGIMLLGVYIISFSQNLSQKVSIVSRSNTTATPQDMPLTTTVTASMAVATTTPTQVHSFNHDVIVYDPVSFDQMWNRLTGRPTEKQEQPVENAPQSAKQDAQITSSSEYLGGFWQRMLPPIEHLRLELEPYVDRLMSNIAEGFALRRQSSAEKLEQIREMHQKLQEFWSDVSKNVQGLTKQSQDHVSDLINHSSQHLRRAQWAGEKQLDRLVCEQKKILARAQTQAHLLVHEVPQQKKRSFFGTF